MQHGRLQRHGNVDLGRETRSGSGLKVAVDAPRPQFFLWLDPRASAVRSSALAGRERAPVTRATPSSPPRRQTWQHEAEVVRGRQGC